MYYSGNYYLSQSEMETNAVFIRDALIGSVTINAICAMLGNMQSESTINPGIWESLNSSDTSRGYGLVQWTPSDKYIGWCSEQGLDASMMESALARIMYEVENNIQWGYDSQGNPPPYSFSEFMQSEDTPYNLAMLFLKHYERPENVDQPNRGTQANEWYEYLTGISPQPQPTRKKKMPIYMYLRQF